MARPTHRLDLVLVPDDAPIGQGHALLQRLVDAGVVREGGVMGPAGPGWAGSPFSRVYVDEPTQPTLYANRLGGFRVSCSSCGANVVPAFSRAMGQWRAGGERRLACPQCGVSTDLAELDFRPPAAFGAWAFVVADTEAASLPTEAHRAVVDALGSVRAVLRRS